MKRKFLDNFKYVIKFIIYKALLILFKFPKIPSIDDTLDHIIKNKLSVSRYGDGEILLMNNKRSISFQDSDLELSRRLNEVFRSKSSKHIVCIPDIFSGVDKYIKRTRYIWMTFLIKNYKQFKINSLKKSNYFNAFITRPYYIFRNRSRAKEIFLKWKEVWNNREIVIIEGDKSRLGVGNDLFNNAKSIKRIICPSVNAFSKYKEILHEANNLDKSKLILIALGPTASVLAYDLYKSGFQAIDIGHIDIEYEWFLRQATEKVKIENKYTNEVTDGDIVSDIKNSEYEHQVIKKIL